MTELRGGIRKTGYYLRVGDVATVPGEQEIHAVGCRKGDVQSVIGGFGRDEAACKEAPREASHRGGKIEQRDAAQQ